MLVWDQTDEHVMIKNDVKCADHASLRNAFAIWNKNIDLS